MEEQKAKIKRFSKVIHIVLNVLIIIFIVVAAMQLVAWIWSVMQLNTEMVVINGKEMEAPLLFKLGDTRVLLPVMWESEFDFSAISGYFPATNFGGFLQTVFMIVGFRFVRKVFILLREDGSPFREEVVKALRKLAIVMLIVGLVSGLIPFLVAGVVWVLSMVFEYGRMLQNESDTTL